MERLRAEKPARHGPWTLLDMHVTHKTRQLLARFFRVHPGYLVDDPEEFRESVGAPLPASADALGAWLHAGAARFAGDPVVA
jgi:hypothetical protein